MNAFAPVLQFFLKKSVYFLLLWCFFLLAEKSFSQCSTVPQVEAVINGDFEQGYIASGAGSFSTDQMYVYDPANAANAALMDAILADPDATICGGCNHPCAWASDGRFHITDYFGAFKCDGGNYDGHPFLSEADGRYDHTKGVGQDGKYLWVDAKAGGGSTSYGVKLWEQDVDIFANQIYYFSAWFINLTPNSNGAARAELRFVVQPYDASDNPIGTPVELGASAFVPAEASRQNNWEQFYNTWTSPIGAVKARLGIYNQSGVAIGNDVGIDDISFVNGCQEVAGLASPPAPDFGVDTVNLCASNGTVTLNSGIATDAGAGRVFTWYSGTSDPQTIIAGPNTTENTLNVSTPGTYRVCVYQPAGCSKSTTIVVTEENSISLGPDESLCQPNSSTVSLNSTLETASAFYTYSWQRNGSPYAGTGASNIASTTGTYTVTATHSSIAACNASDSKIVNNTNTMTTDLGSNQNLCNGSTTTLTSSLTGTAFTYEWLKDGVVISGATSSSYVASETGTYTVNLIHPVTGCNVTDNVVVTNTNPMTAGHDTFCSGGPANLSVTPNATCPYKWYTTATGGLPIAGTVGSCTYNPSPAGTTTYYVEDTTAVSFTGIGMTGALPTVEWDWGNNVLDEGLIFNTTKVVIIESVDIWVQEWASISNLLVRVLDGSSNVLGTSAPISYNNGVGTPTRVTVPLNITVPIGTGHKIIIPTGSGTSGALRMSGALGGPYNSPGGGLTINGSTNGRYNFFTDWAIKEKANTCSRLAVTATLEVPCVTPVEFLHFSVKNANHGAALHWATATEINSDYFVIERSSDGVHFESIGTVKAAGNSKDVLNYHFKDEESLTGITYYRIREVDLDGAQQLSAIRTINIKPGFSFTVYPNPGQGVYQVHVSSLLSDAQITLYDVTGKAILHKTISQESNTGFEINIQHLPSGIYYLEVKSAEGVNTQKLIKE